VDASVAAKWPLVALGELSGASLWTNDKLLLRLLAGKVAFVHWIADYRA
jgi:hypothetical protein